MWETIINHWYYGNYIILLAYTNRIVADKRHAKYDSWFPLKRDIFYSMASHTYDAALSAVAIHKIHP